MPPSLRKAVAAAIGGGAIAIASVLITGPSGNDGLEGVRHNPYKDIVGVWTVCHGHTGKDIMLGKTYTEAECKALLNKDLATVARQINPYIKVDIPETTRGALYSFVYNVGAGNFRTSTLLRKINQGDMRGWTIKGKPASDRAVLSQEQDGIKSHTHSASASNTDLGTKNTSSFDYGTKSTNNTGAHTHSVSGTAASAGAHTHPISQGDNANVSSGRVASSNSAQTHLGATNSSGAHTHSVSGTAASAGAHTHTVGIGAHTHSVAIGSHGHTITVNAAGNAENTVKNIAFNYIVRLA